MIKINLLPYRDVQKKEKVWQQIFTMLGGVLLGFVVLAVAHIFLVRIENGYEKNKEDLNSEIKNLEKQIGEMDKIKAQKAEIERKLSIIEKLSLQRLDMVGNLYNIASSIPDNLWLTSFSDKGSEIILDGEAFSANEVSIFMKRIEETKKFGKVTLLTLDQAQKGEQKVLKFNIKVEKVKSGT